MKSVLEIIKPIVLCVGTHDISRTGQGCVMNVASYLAGDQVITDRPRSVDPTIGRLARTDNDFSNQTDRQGLLPYVMRMIGSTTTDRGVLAKRADIFQSLISETFSDLGRVWAETGKQFGEIYYAEYLRLKLQIKTTAALFGLGNEIKHH